MNISQITIGWAVLMGVTAGLNLATGNYALGTAMAVSGLIVGYCATKGSWFDGHTAATRDHIVELREILRKLDEEKKQQPPEDWWKEGQK